MAEISLFYCIVIRMYFDEHPHLTRPKDLISCAEKLSKGWVDPETGLPCPI
jgi:hypothetical protein